MHEDVVRDLTSARTRTLELTDLDEPTLIAQHDPLMSPLVWDLAHVGQQEELWLLRAGDPARPGMLPPEVDSLYDAFKHKRAERPSLPLMPPVEPIAGERVFVPGGRFVLGVDATTEPFSLDNERPAHNVEVAPFWIGRVPVTNRQWLDFIGDDGYHRQDLWSSRGWVHRIEAGLERPRFWTANGTRRRFGTEEDIPFDEPVQHVCYYEAEAFAAWSHARLPTEIEWEKACAWDPDRQARRTWPWGSQPPTEQLANLGGLGLRPAPVGAFPAGASAYGAEQMIGDVWEWTSSDFAPWPGFTPMIYRSYSEPFFGSEYKVLRGGSWAVAPSTIRPSFRNWDYPIRRQIFTGVRLAWDA